MAALAQLAIEVKTVHPSVPHTKRFLEYWSADREFRQAYDADPLAAVQRYGLEVEPAKLRALVDTHGIGPESEEVISYRAFIKSKLEFRNRYRTEGAPSDERFRVWRQRQMKRAFWDLGPTRADSVVHAPICFELSKGCTVGCWFCGVGAKGFGGNFEYTAPHAALWRGTLEAARALIGPGAGCGFCYWATDPLDNPDYEKFVADFHAILGRLPQTTTAVPLRELARTRALLDMSRRLTHGVERFSVLSPGQFRRLMEAFRPEELLMVELIPQFNHDVSPKVLAGAVREKLTVSGGAGVPATSTRNTEDGGTIACVSGFLVNMVERKVRLISPCSANERWPLGYMVFDEFRFDTPSDFRAGVEAALSNAMKMTVGTNDPIRVHPRLAMTRHEDAVTLSNSAVSVKMKSQIESAVLAEMIARAATLGEIATARAARCGVPHVWTYQEVQGMWNEGMLDEEMFLRPSQ